jgi:predicted phage terminase large subunit-like protein
VRATCNPDADSWLAGFLAWWIDEGSGLAIPERAGVVRWLVRTGERLVWAEQAEQLREQFPDRAPKSVTFIPAKVTDNRILLEKDPGYLANLQALPPVDRGRLLEGNWKIKPEAGKVFHRSWFEVVPQAPSGGAECRFFDFAATAKEQRGDDPDFTAGVKVRSVGGVFYVLDCVAQQIGPAAGDALFVNTAVQDALAAKQAGAAYRIRWEQEPGASGIKDSRRLVGLLRAAFAKHGLPLDAQGVRPQGDKLARAKALASTAQVGDVKLVAGRWNEAWLRHMHGQPDLPHDDIMDASAGAFNELSAGRREARSYQG